MVCTNSSRASTTSLLSSKPNMPMLEMHWPGWVVKPDTVYITVFRSTDKHDYASRYHLPPVLVFILVVEHYRFVSGAINWNGRWQHGNNCTVILSILGSFFTNGSRDRWVDWCCVSSNVVIVPDHQGEERAKLAASNSDSCLGDLIPDKHEWMNWGMDNNLWFLSQICQRCIKLEKASSSLYVKTQRKASTLETLNNKPNQFSFSFKVCIRSMSKCFFVLTFHKLHNQTADVLLGRSLMLHFKCVGSFHSEQLMFWV